MAGIAAYMAGNAAIATGIAVVTNRAATITQRGSHASIFSSISSSATTGQRASYMLEKSFMS
jgi:Pyruvate/2-oxoacid:ferredoxin oxidoreductase gamma subunit